jgi:alkanesulfonate monooxygenase SsuD/methylene tetrahydromethanopterin reductase-like flavin-dependent oxidoreductase (luciferase family)
MEVGVHFIGFLPGAPEKLGPTMAGSAKIAEQAGVTLFTLADHFFQMETVGQAQDPFLEGYTTLGFLAGQTEKITLSMMVSGVTYRNPGIFAKTVTTLDVLSQGRSMLGIGAAWYEREHLRHWGDDSKWSKRRYRSARRCGVKTTARTKDSTTSLPRRSASHNRSGVPRS